MTLTLPGRDGPLVVAFIIDTGFEGDLAVPDDLARQLDATYAGSTVRLLADASPHKCPALEMFFDDGIDARIVEVLVLPGEPLIGTAFLHDYHVHIEMANSGEVVAEKM
jgi:predicted aspartyl protease